MHHAEAVMDNTSKSSEAFSGIIQCCLFFNIFTATLINNKLQDGCHLFHLVEPLSNYLFPYSTDNNDDDSNDRDRKDRKDDRKSSKERSSKDKVGQCCIVIECIIYI